MKKFIYVMFCILLLASCSSNVTTNQKIKTKTMIANPWTDCNDDLVKASKIAGFTFPLMLSNYTVRAMDGMFEISYPLDEFRNVCVRKVMVLKDNQTDISGVYIKYPINKEMRLKNGVPIQIKADKNKIYVINMSASKGYYSAYCKEGMSLKEVEGIYSILVEAEAEK